MPEYEFPLTQSAGATLVPPTVIRHKSEPNDQSLSCVSIALSSNDDPSAVSQQVARPRRMQPCVARWLLAAPFFVVAVILIWSPNFRVPVDGQNVVLTDPLGSDFLQEWIGGYIIVSPDRAELYHSEHFLAVEHDAALVGFQWPTEDYYPMVYPPSW